MDVPPGVGRVTPVRAVSADLSIVDMPYASAKSEMPICGEAFRLKMDKGLSGDGFPATKLP